MTIGEMSLAKRIGTVALILLVGIVSIAFLFWTPFWGTYNDTWEFEFSDSGIPASGISDTVVIQGQELYAKGECTNGGTGIGIVGRKALTARRALRVAGVVSEAIMKTYEDAAKNRAKP